MKRDLGIEREQPGRHTSTLTKRLAHREEADPAPAAPAPPPTAAGVPAGQARGGARRPGRGAGTAAVPTAEPPAVAGDGDGIAPAPAPDIAENEGVSPIQKPKPPAKSRTQPPSREASLMGMHAGKHPPIEQEDRG